MDGYIERSFGTSAYMKYMGGGVWKTEVRSNGQLVKIVDTPPSQIRPPRETMLWKVGDPIEGRSA